MNERRRGHDSAPPFVLVLFHVIASFGIPILARASDEAAASVATSVPAPGEFIDLYLDAFADARGLDGTILVAQGDRVLVHRAFGLANRVWSVPNRPDTRFVVASVTKPFTAMATLILAERGEIRLDAPIAEYLSPYRADVASEVTVHDLLAHTSGIPNFANREFFVGSAARLDYDRWSFIERFCSGDLLFEPGTQSRYSDANYVLLATLLERVTGETFGELLDRLIFTPAGMTDSEVITRHDVHPGVASSYVTDSGEPRRPYFINYADVQRGAGDMITSATDLHRWVRALQRGELLSDESREKMFYAHAASGFPGLMQGYGWNLGTLAVQGLDDGIEFAHAPGNNGGYNAVVYLLPASDVMIAILLNTGTPWLDHRLFEIGETIITTLAGARPTLPRPSMVPLVRKAIDTAEHGELPARCRGLQNSGLFDLDERGMNRLGYDLLQAGKVTDAIDVFKFIVESAPGSANAHDSLGEGYWNAGRLDEALASYQKSVELAPDNQNGHRMIAIIREKLSPANVAP